MKLGCDMTFVAKQAIFTLGRARCKNSAFGHHSPFIQALMTMKIISVGVKDRKSFHGHLRLGVGKSHHMYMRFRCKNNVLSTLTKSMVMKREGVKIAQLPCIIQDLMAMKLFQSCFGGTKTSLAKFHCHHSLGETSQCSQLC